MIASASGVLKASVNVEYADVFGISFDFTAKPVVAPIQPPRETIQVKAVRPERDHLEIVFPRIQGYRVELPEERLEAEFADDSILVLTPELTGPSEVVNSGIIGERASADRCRLNWLILESASPLEEDVASSTQAIWNFGSRR